MHKTVVKVVFVLLLTVIVQSPQVGAQSVTSNWRDNPYNCDTKTQWIRADNLKCLNKQRKLKKISTWRDNPYNCDTKTQWIRADNYKCLNKNGTFSLVRNAVAVRQSAVQPKKSPVSTSSWRDNPYNCDTNTQWIRADNYRCVNKLSGALTTEATRPSVTAQPVASVQQPRVLPQTGGGGCSSVYSYSNWNADVAYGVCMAESSGNPGAYNPESHGSCAGSRGLFQIACVHGYKSTFDAAANVKYANELWQRSGWSIWGAYTSGKYVQFL